ncbi:MAG: hypothetical protein OXL97_06990 [Chloroflexota bacterium]|nr:hypothetical protein [Chloroflexota bacterium]MDE2885704.1 hypothetical protein [Chloroflexota bacterium]
MLLSKRFAGSVFLVVIMLAVLGGSTALASDGAASKALVSEDDESDVTIVVEGYDDVTSPVEGDTVADVGRDSTGKCNITPYHEIHMTGDVSVVELSFDPIDCQLSVSSIERSTELAELSSHTTQASNNKYYHWFMKTSATRRGFAYFEELTTVRTHIQAWLPYYGYRGPIRNANNAWHECDAWDDWNRWRVVSCRLDSKKLNSSTSVHIKASGKFEWNIRVFKIKTSAWAKSEIRSHRIGTDRFKSTCGHRSTYNPVRTYTRCERKYGFV